MRRSTASTRPTILVLMLALMAAGCTSIAERAVEGIAEQAAQADGADIDIDLDGENISISGADDEGNEFNLGTGGELPQDFPGDLPLPADFAVLSSFSQNDGSSNVSMTTTSSFEQAVDLYRSGLPGAGYTITEEFSSTNTQQVFSAMGNGRNVNVAIISAGDVTVNITVTSAQ